MCGGVETLLLWTVVTGPNQPSLVDSVGAIIRAITHTIILATRGRIMTPVTRTVIRAVFSLLLTWHATQHVTGMSLRMVSLCCSMILPLIIY